jgi:hypothetical protein
LVDHTEAQSFSGNAAPTMGHNGGPPLTDDTLMSSRQICRRFNIAQMTLWRWRHADDVEFPHPTMRISTRDYWTWGSIHRWQAKHVARQAELVAQTAKQNRARLARGNEALAERRNATKVTPEPKRAVAKGAGTAAKRRGARTAATAR